MSESTLYEWLGGVFAISAVVDHFSDAVVLNPKASRWSAGNPDIMETAIQAA